VVKVFVEKRVAESKHYFQTAKVYGIGDGTWFRKITLARSEIMKREELIEKLKLTFGTIDCNGEDVYYVTDDDDWNEIIDFISPPIESKPFNPHSPECELRKE